MDIKESLRILLRNLFPENFLAWMQYYALISMVFGFISGTILSVAYLFEFSNDYIIMIFFATPMLTWPIKIFWDTSKKLDPDRNILKLNSEIYILSWLMALGNMLAFVISVFLIGVFFLIFQ